MIEKLTYCETENTYPYRNLAEEAYLTFHVEKGECILFLWQNRQTVVIGKNQNCWKECRVSQLEEGGGYLVRRLSGGGAVFHDLGNLNFTFCVREEDYDVSRQMDVILEAVRLLGIEAEKTGRNDITADGRKFSGNAFYRSGGCCYHHGTLLVDVDQRKMAEYLQVSKEKLESKGVNSVRSRTVNLKELNPLITVDALKDALRKAFGMVYSLPVQPLAPERMDSAEIGRLQQKFESHSWKYGRPIPFQHGMAQRFAWGDVQLQFQVNCGRVTDVNVFSDGMEQDFLSALPELWKDCPYDAASLCCAMDQYRGENGGDQAFSQTLSQTFSQTLSQTLSQMKEDIASLLRANL
ncbi:MAG: lipoate--protein ligase [Firmicutes bacterium]|nr:lipoate--protein ligase [Bacillota bacterium]